MSYADVYKRTIRRLLTERPGMDEMDLAEALDISLDVVCRLLDDMVREGTVERDEGAAALDEVRRQLGH